MPDAPAGWDGPFALFEGPPEQLPECAGAFGEEVFTAGTIPIDEPVACSACTCNATGPSTCSQSATAYDQSAPTGVTACGRNSGTFTLTTSCTAPSGTIGYRFGDFTTGRTCSANGGDVASRPEIQWQAVARGCARGEVPSEGCAEGLTCQPAPQPPLLSDLCVARAGAHSCPGGYPSSRTYFTDAVDERSCSECSCSSTLTCSGTYRTYSVWDCSGTQSTSFGEVNGCVYANQQHAALRLENVVQSGSCTPTVSGPVGSVKRTGQLTVCCQAAAD